MRELRFTSWDQFNAWNASRDGWAFRGEQDASWPLISSLASSPGSARCLQAPSDQATLFPDLDGLARSIAYELEEAWPLPVPQRAG